MTLARRGTNTPRGANVQPFKNSTIMKIFVLTEIDLQHVGFAPNTVQLFPTLEAASSEMYRMYTEALKRFDTTEDDVMNVYDESGYARIGENEYLLDIYECVIDPGFPAITTLQELTVTAEELGIREKLMRERNLSRDEVWVRMQHWADEFEKKYEGYDYYANNTSLYDEIDAFLYEKRQQLDNPELHPEADEDVEVTLCDEAMFSDGHITVMLHVYDGYAEGFGIRVEYPKLSELTPQQIDEMDVCLGGRIKDSMVVCPADVLLKYGRVVSFDGIMDTTNGHDPELVCRINCAWVENADKFEPIMKALYTRDIDEITDNDAFQYPEWLNTMQNELGLETGNWHDYNVMALEDMCACWKAYVENYLMHIADDGDLETILGFVR